MFENYEEKTETDSLYRRIGLTVLLFVVLGIPAIIYLDGKFESRNPQLDHTVSLSDEPAARTAEDLCESLPKPEKFEFKGKREPKNDYEQHLVVFDYSSPRRPEEILPSFLLWFSENGWQNLPEAETTFRKENFSIYIRHESTPTVTNYSVYCSEKK